MPILRGLDPVQVPSHLAIVGSSTSINAAHLRRETDIKALVEARQLPQAREPGRA